MFSAIDRITKSSFSTTTLILKDRLFPLKAVHESLVLVRQLQDTVENQTMI